MRLSQNFKIARKNLEPIIQAGTCLKFSKLAMHINFKYYSHKSYMESKQLKWPNLSTFISYVTVSTHHVVMPQSLTRKRHSPAEHSEIVINCCYSFEYERAFIDVRVHYLKIVKMSCVHDSKYV